MNADLVVLVPDKDIEQTILGIMKRHRALKIRPLSGISVLVHPNHDPGVYNTGHELLAPYAKDHRYALVCYDCAWEGAPSEDRIELARHVEKKCAQLWGDRVRCIAIAPEIEAWVWSDSPQVASVLGWPSLHQLRDWLQTENVWPENDNKPPDPKLALQKALRHGRIRPSSSIFRQLAEKVSFRRCSDPAFQELTDTLRRWFQSPDSVNSGNGDV